MKKTLIITLAFLMVLGLVSFVVNAEEEVKIGFLVKQPEEPWFQDEWKYADQAAEDYGFELIKLGVPDGEAVLSAIDNIAAQGAQGFIICTPDKGLGPAIIAQAEMYGLKLMTVDTSLENVEGKRVEDVPHMGIDAYNIGELAGETIVKEMNKREWNYDEVGCLNMTWDQLPSMKERTDGATNILMESGLPEENIFDSPLKTLDIEGSLNAANSTINKHGGISKWVVTGGNDHSVIGAVRALEGQGFEANQIIAMGINGSESAVNEFEKDEPTGFHASVRLAANRHGYETSELMYKWITEDEKPPMNTWTTGKLITEENYKDAN